MYNLIFILMQVIFIMIGRLLCGNCCGILCVLIPIYVAEIANKEIRNRLMMFFHLLINCGIMYAFLIDYLQEEEKIIWQYSLLCGISCVPIACIIFLPESAFYYLTKNDESMAKQSLQRYQNNSNDDDDGVDDDVDSNDFGEKLEELKSLAAIFQTKAGIFIFNV